MEEELDHEGYQLEGGRESPDLFQEVEDFSGYTEENGRTSTKNVEPSTSSSLCVEAPVQCSTMIPKKTASLDSSPPLSRIGLNDHKAGMQGIDKAKINQIILEASKGSKFYENEVKKEKQVTKRISCMLEELKKVTPEQKAAALMAADGELELLKSAQDLSHIIVHVDMDAFYAAVEMRDNPRLKEVPMAVGSNSMLVGLGLSSVVCVSWKTSYSRLSLSVNFKLSRSTLWGACSNAWIHWQEALPGANHRSSQLHQVQRSQQTSQRGSLSL